MIDILPNRTRMPEDLNYQVTKREWDLLNERNFTCSCCGFKSAPTQSVPSGYIEVLVDSSRAPYLLCAVCASAKRLGRNVGGTFNHGIMLHIANLDQAQVSNAARILLTQVNNSLSLALPSNQMISDLLLMKAESSDFVFLKDSGSVEQTANALESLKNTTKQDPSPLIKNLRYFPSKASYRDIFNYWLEVNPSYFSPPPSS